ncbi:MAG: hypothetical protein HQM06_01510 [Magnetococcales bacterium]|nr:hypothetical protein [Magnetococcales bacterium]
MNLIQKLGSGFLFLVLSPMLATLAINHSEMRRSITEYYQESLRSAAINVISVDFPGLMRSSQNYIKDVAKDPRLVAAVEAAIRDRKSGNAQGVREIVTEIRDDVGLSIMEVVAMDGTMLFSSSAHRNNVNLSQQDIFQRASKEKEGWATQFVYDDIKKQYIILTGSLIKYHNAPVGMLLGGFVLDAEKLKELANHGDVFLIKQDDTSKSVDGGALAAVVGSNASYAAMQAVNLGEMNELYQQVKVACERDVNAASCQKPQLRVWMKEVGDDLLIYAAVPVRLGQTIPFGSLVIAQNANQMREDSNRSLYFGFGITAIFATISVFLGFLLTRSIVKNIRSMVELVATATGQVLSSANGIAAAVSDEVAIATEQSAAVTEITASMEELSATSNQINENAGSVLSVSTQTLEVADQGRIAAEQVMRTMKQINDDNQKTISDVVELGRKSQEINRVMEIINGIADQTKLIAFNAAIEASSAGEAGARFGVVAVEIRRLADSVMESTREISDNLKEIQESVNRLVIASEAGAKGIQSGSSLTEETVGFLNDIFSGAQATNDAAKQISLSTQQQKTATTQIVFALKEIEMGSQQISVSIHTTHDTCTALMQLANHLSEQVGQFKSI